MAASRPRLRPPVLSSVWGASTFLRACTDAFMKAVRECRPEAIRELADASWPVTVPGLHANPPRRSPQFRRWAAKWHLREEGSAIYRWARDTTDEWAQYPARRQNLEWTVAHWPYD